MIIAQLSDAHITDGQDEPSDRFARIVAHVMRLPARPDVVIVTGDCVENGTHSEYQRFQELLRPLTMPVYVIPGNHDNRDAFLTTFGAQGEHALEGFAQYTVEGWPVRLIALDTHIPGRGAGELCERRRQWLRDRLAEAPTQPTLVFMHHPPFAIGIAVFDAIGLSDPVTFGGIIQEHPQVERIVAGHIHMMMLQRFYGTIAVTCPASAQHMLPDFSQPDKLVAQLEPTSCLLHIWDDNTGLMTLPSMIGDHGPLVTLHDGTRWT